MDMTDLWRAVRRFWLLCFATLVATTALGYAFATSSEPNFEATATVAVSPNPTEGASTQLTEFEIPIIVAVATSRDFVSSFSDALSEDAISTRVTIAAGSEGGIVRVTASGGDASSVAEWANAAAASIVTRYAPTDDDPATPPTTADLVSVELVEFAVVPGGSGEPNVLPVMIASVVLGLILAGAVAAVAYKSSVAFDLSEQIRLEVGIPVIGEIPTLRELRSPDSDLRTPIELHSPALIEALQSLRINTELHMNSDTRVLAVTSLERHEGKSTIAAALSIMLASAGREVVAIDTDLRSSSLHLRLGEPFGEGLAQFDELGPEMIVQRTQDPGLSFVPAGISDRHPAQVIAVALPRTIEVVLEYQPDAIVLLDSPSFGPVHDGTRGVPRIVAESSTVIRAADEVLIVIQATTSKLPEIATSVQRLQDEGVTVIGAVINRQRKLRWWRL
jgi:MinD-like ATPase involved in chromosome partitioning or flagellar assembly/capsular polysaccharide biosynthesis protein